MIRGALRESYSKFGIGLNGGSLPSRIVERDASRMAVGQLFCSTPDEIARAYVVLANYGKSPWSGEQIVSTNAVKAYLPALVSVASPKGTARRAAVDGVKVAGKTGTAQRKMDGRYLPGMYNATFAGFFPSDNPKYVIVVLYQNADKNDRFHQGGQRPALAFADIVRLLIGKNVDSKTADYAVNDRVTRQRLEDMGLKELAKKIDKARIAELTRLVAELRDDQQRLDFKLAFLSMATEAGLQHSRWTDDD